MQVETSVVESPVRQKSRWPFLVLGVVAGVVLGVVLNIEFIKTISVDDSGVPVVAVKEEWSLLWGHEEYSVWLGESENYGHPVEVPLGAHHTPEIVRGSDGVELKFNNGDRIFVPASVYLGGR